MAFRKFSAEYIFNGFEFLPPNTVIVTDEEGVICAITSQEDAGGDVQHHAGILSPGLINAHCHVELSHMKNTIPKGIGLINFLINVVKKRAAADISLIKQNIADAEDEMLQNGIVAVGDIANTTLAIDTKKTGRLRWHNFIEVLNFFDHTLEERLKFNEDILCQHTAELKYNSALTPHAPYTISSATFKALNERTRGRIISIHNQEAAAENELFQTGEGEFLRLFEEIGVGASPFKPTGKTSLQTYLPFFNNLQTIVLVHNTFISKEDVLFAKEHAANNGLQIVYCLCPNANLFIERRVPPIKLFQELGCSVVLGTDSYSSNTQLSIAMEAATLQQHFPKISTEYLLRCATSNAASAFGWDDLGTLKTSLQPGIVLWETTESLGLMLTGQAKRLI